jgi:hypothetical protein
LGRGGSEGFGDEEVGDEGGRGTGGAVAVCGDRVPEVVLIYGFLLVCGRL